MKTKSIKDLDITEEMYRRALEVESAWQLTSRFDARSLEFKKLNHEWIKLDDAFQDEVNDEYTTEEIIIEYERRMVKMTDLIDRSKLEPDAEWSDYDDDYMSYSAGQIKNAPTVKAVTIDKLKNLVNKLQDEKDYAYANFDEYKLDVLGCDDVDDLPNDDYRFGLNRAIKLLQLLIVESEEE